MRSRPLQPVWPTRMSWLDWMVKRIEAFFDSDRQVFRAVQVGRTARAISVSGDSIGYDLLLAARGVFCLIEPCSGFVEATDERAADGEASARELGTAARLGDLPEGISAGGRRSLGRSAAPAGGAGIWPAQWSVCSRTSSSVSINWV